MSEYMRFLTENHLFHFSFLFLFFFPEEASFFSLKTLCYSLPLFTVSFQGSLLRLTSKSGPKTLTFCWLLLKICEELFACLLDLFRRFNLDLLFLFY